MYSQILAHQFHNNKISGLLTGEEEPTYCPVCIRIFAGVTTGALSVSLAQPTDVVKVRMQAQFGANKGRYSGTMDAYRTIYKTEGTKGLWRGNQKLNNYFNMFDCVYEKKKYVLRDIATRNI